MGIRNTEIPNFLCSDPDVQSFLEEMIWDFNPYGPSTWKTGRDLIDAAIERFGLWKCYDIHIPVH